MLKTPDRSIKIGIVVVINGVFDYLETIFEGVVQKEIGFFFNSEI